ncbi:hypothetical protein M569_07956, partial [Genlisea aurea]
QQMPVNNHNQQQPAAAVAASSQSQPQGRPYFPGHFHLSEPQAEVYGGASRGGQTAVGISSSPSISTTPSSGTAATVKRVQKPPSRPSGGASAQGTASLMKTMELAPAPLRRKRKLPDKAILYKVAAMYPETSLFTQLLDFEARIDAILSRKKAEISESLRNPVCIKRVLRIYVFNTYSSETKESSSEKENSGPTSSWSLRIIGRILEDGKDPELGDHLSKGSNRPYPKFSSFFKKITIYLDQSLYPDNHVIVWDSSRSPALHKGFEVKRRGDQEFTAVIRFEMSYAPERFKLSPALQEVLGIELETRPRIMTALWHYVKSKKLQIPGDSSYFACDAALKKVFGDDRLKFSMVNQKIAPHITSPGPIHLEHRMKLSGPTPSGNSCYDVPVDVPLSTAGSMSNFLTDLDRNEEIDPLDETVSSCMKKIHEHYRRRAFFLGFSHSPAEFINALIASQARDLKLVAGDATGEIEKEKRAGFYEQSWVEDAVIRYLNRKSSEASGNK